MIRNSYCVRLGLLAVLCISLTHASSAEEEPRFTIDGGPTHENEWWNAPGGHDSDDDVAPQQISGIDLRWITYDKGVFGTPEQPTGEDGFLFLFNFGGESPDPFAGSEERSLEIFFDTVAIAGDETTVWKDTPYDWVGKDLVFAPDQRARLSWKEGGIVELGFEVWAGGGWQARHVGPSIPEIEAAIDRWWMEVAVRWSEITPQRYTEGEEDYEPFAFALRTTQGASNDYYPDPGQEGWSCPLLPEWTVVPATSWGALKTRTGE